MSHRTIEERRWADGLAAGEFGVWDLAPRLDLVHYAPAWKARLGFAPADVPDGTSFWRCRVHPDDLAPMLRALRRHLDGATDTYEARFRIRSSGSGYHMVLSRGRVVERDACGDALRMLGTMVKLSDRPFRPATGMPLPDADAGADLRRADVPFHRLLGASAGEPDSAFAGLPRAAAASCDALIGQVADLLDAAAAHAADAA